MLEKMTTEMKVICALIGVLVLLSAILIITGNDGSKTSRTKETVNLTKDEKKEEETEPETIPIAIDDNEDDNRAEEKAEKLLEKLSLHEKICQMFIVTPEQLTGAGVATMAGDMTKSSIENYPVGGMIYFSQNIEDEDQIKDMISTTQDYMKEVNDAPLFIGVDEEGGSIARVADSLGTTKLEDMFSYKDEGTDTARENAKTIAEDISKYGFNLDFAPVCDVFADESKTAIGNRCYSDSYDGAASLIENAVKGFEEGNVMCTLKHFPGLGETDGDTHDGKVSSNVTLEELADAEYLPFESGIDAGAPCVMVSHLVMSEVDELPASLSYTMVTQELREELKFDGVVITDAMNMGAITNNYSISEATIMAIKAGVDIVLMPNDLASAVSAVEDAVKDGDLSEERIDESVLRFLSAKYQYIK